MTSSLTFRGVTLSASPAHQWTYDVFLSTDTRNNFTNHLYAALDRRGMSTYIDDEQHRSQENISSALLKAIEESRISVVVLSKNYAASPWCLDELQKILEYKKTKGQIVIPVFYQVHPSDVVKSFGLEKRFKDDLPKVQKWKAALSEIADLSGSGWHLNNNGDEGQCVDEIVEKIANHIKAAKHVAKHPIAIESPLHVPDSSSSPAQVPDSSSSPSRVGKESPAQAPDSPRSPSSDEIQGPVQEVNLSSSYEIQVPVQEVNLSCLDEIQATVPGGNLPSSPEIQVFEEANYYSDETQASEQEVNLSSSPEIQVFEEANYYGLDETQASEQEVNLSSSHSGNGDQGSNPSISSEQGSNSSKLSQGAILMLIGSVIGIVIGILQFEKHPANTWIALAAWVMFCLLNAIMMKIDGTRWAKYSLIIDGFCVLSGLLVAVSMISLDLPLRLWWLNFVIWALLGFILVYSWDRRNKEKLQVMSEILIDEILKIVKRIKAAKQVAKHPIAIKSPLHVPDSPSSPAQVPDSSSSPSRVGKESPAQAPDSPHSPSSDEIQVSEEVNLSSSDERQATSVPGGKLPSSQIQLHASNLTSPTETQEDNLPCLDGIQVLGQDRKSSSSTGNGVQGSDSSKSSVQGSHPFFPILLVIAGYIELMTAILQLGNFEKYPANIWTAHVALFVFCGFWVALLSIDGTRCAKYSEFIIIMCVGSASLVPASLLSIHLPHQWRILLPFVIMGIVVLARLIFNKFAPPTWRVNRRNDEEKGPQGGSREGMMKTRV